MNFLKQGSSGLTYKSLVYGLAGWVVLLGVIYGIQFLRYWLLRDEMTQAKHQVTNLNEEKEKQVEMIKLMSNRRIGVSAQENLTVIIANRPRWSRVLQEIARALPSDVWLDSIKVKGGGDEWYTILIRGEAKSQRVLTDFILRLESSGLFAKTALDNTKLASKASGSVSYELSTQPVMKKLMEDDG
jgi:Tfp pilus assembly protein PilN